MSSHHTGCRGEHTSSNAAIASVRELSAQVEPSPAAGRQQAAEAMLGCKGVDTWAKAGSAAMGKPSAQVESDKVQASSSSSANPAHV